MSRLAHPEAYTAFPEAYTAFPEDMFAAPDDDAGDGQSWREKLVAYNQTPETNLLGFAPAAALYRQGTYAELQAHVRADKLFILSAGWGLVRSDFLLPDYNITFSGQADRGIRRRRTDEGWPDFNHLPTDTDEPVVCFGGQSYRRFFSRLTTGMTAPRHAFERVAPGQPHSTRQKDGITLHSYPTDRRTNWHHDCARDFITGQIGV